MTDTPFLTVADVARLVVMTEPWTIDNDLITPTFKVKRNRVEERFARQYPCWVGSRRAVVWHPA